MKLPRFLRKATAAELIADKRLVLQEAIETERTDLQTSIYETEKAIHASQHNLEYQKQRLEFLDATFPVHRTYDFLTHPDAPVLQRETVDA